MQLFTWYHVAMSYDGHELTLYVNGQLEASVPADGPLVITSVPVIIGMTAGWPTSNIQGLIDEPSLYNRALAAAEIQAIYNAGSAGKCQGVPLTPLAAQATLSVGAPGGDDTFALQATFILGDGSNGIDPLTEAVTLQVGPAALTMPAGAFHRTATGVFTFAGVVEGVTLQVTITRLTRASFEIEAQGEGAALSGMAVPVAGGSHHRR